MQKDETSGKPGNHWFESAADHLGKAYLRYSFTKGTLQEVDFLIDELALKPGDRILDVGCGPGRHALEFAKRGFSVTGVDISSRFVDLANEQAAQHGIDATFVRVDARTLSFSEEFDAVISLCQGAFGLQGAINQQRWSAIDEDLLVLEGIARSMRPGGVAAISAFSAYFQVRYLEDADTFDVATGVNHERTALRSSDGQEIEHDLWTTCLTPRELRFMSKRAGLDVAAIYSVAPGRYGANEPDLDSPEFLVIASKGKLRT